MTPNHVQATHPWRRMSVETGRGNATDGPSTTMIAMWLLGFRGTPLLRGAPCGDDLIGGFPCQFSHMVEPEGEGAGAGSGRAHLDDEVADLGFRHLGAHHVPAVP